MNMANFNTRTNCTVIMLDTAHCSKFIHHMYQELHFAPPGDRLSCVLNIPQASGQCPTRMLYKVPTAVTYC